MSKGRKLLRQGILLTEEGKWVKAISQLEAALNRLLVEGDQEMIALCRSFLGMAYRPQKRYEDALEQFKEFLKLVTALKDHFGIAQAHFDIGLTFSLQKKYEAALDHLKKSLQITREQLKDKDVEARTLANLGGIYLLMGNYDVAYSVYKEGAQIAEKIDFIEGASECYKGLAEIYTHRGEWQQAEKYYQKSLGLYRLLKLKPEIANILYRLGILYTTLGSFKDAIFYFKQAKTLKRDVSDLLGESLCKKNLKALQQKIKDKDLPNKKRSNR
ncbi:MAG: tetratricopeptide repeat protein [Candidatus Helarchaeota archaeon]